MISASSGLEQRIKTEGANSPADVLLTVDVARLQDAIDAGITQPIKSAVLEKAVPKAYHGPDGAWYGISMRARVVYASKERVKQDAITYEELADPKWKGKICIRSGQHMYNNALFAAYLAKHGEAKTEEWLKGLKANLAQKPSGGDREVARDIAAGKCDIGLGNTYYWALMNDKEAERKPWADATKVILPTFQGGGTHVNLSGVVLAKHAPNKANAIKLMEWLVGEHAQHLYADMNYEYPLLSEVKVNPTIAGLRHAQAGLAAARRGRQAQEGRGEPGRQGRVRQLSRWPSLLTLTTSTRRAAPARRRLLLDLVRPGRRRVPDRGRGAGGRSRSPIWCASRSPARATSGPISPPM